MAEHQDFKSVFFRKCSILTSFIWYAFKEIHVFFFAGKSRSGGLTSKNLFL